MAKAIKKSKKVAMMIMSIKIMFKIKMMIKMIQKIDLLGE